MKYLLLTILTVNLLSCSSGTNQNSKSNSTTSSYYSSSNYTEEEEEDFNDGYESDNNEGIKDDTYSATVDYYNPNTNYSATYTLDVEVEDGQVTVIYFPNDGYLDDDHIYPTDLDEDGYAEVEGEDGKTYEVQIDL